MTYWRDKPKPSYVTTLDLISWRNASLAERTLHVAASQVGVREVGENWGMKVKMFLASAGILSPAAWCAAFLTWCLLQAGADRKKLPRFAASTYYWYQWAAVNDLIVNRAVRGCFGVQNGAKGGHIWCITKDSERQVVHGNEVVHVFETIEGNTNEGGSREGVGVFRRKRTEESMKAYPRFAFIAIPDSLGVGS